MVRCVGKKGAVIHRYNERMRATKDIVKSMPFKDKKIIAAVYADGKSYRINGCEGMDKAPESVRIIGRSEDGKYQVVWGNSSNFVEVGHDELSARLDSYFGESRAENVKSTENVEVTTEEHDEDR